MDHLLSKETSSSATSAAEEMVKALCAEARDGINTNRVPNMSICCFPKYLVSEVFDL